MTNKIDLLCQARAIFDVALRSVDAGEALRSAVQVDGPCLTIQESTIDLSDSSKSIYALAIGKAAFPMAAALDELLGKRIAGGLVVGTFMPGPFGKLFSPPGKFVTPWQYCTSSHPLPSESSLAAAKSAFELLRRANEEHALVIFLISGGGSSMIEWPLDEQITLADLSMANRALVSCGANIAEINAVRRAFSAIKGGRLAMLAPDADQITLVVSDTPKGQESNVASGPTYDPPSEGPDAAEVIAQYNLEGHLPKPILQATTSQNQHIAKNMHKRMREFYVLLDNETALVAAINEARRHGFDAELAKEISDQPIAEGCRMMLSQLYDFRSRSEIANKAVCLISGGEFSCPVRGNGIGGRNAETVLRCAMEIHESRRRHDLGSDKIRHEVLSAGTDGIDGNSPAAGAVASHESIERALEQGLNPADFVERSDAYSFFKAIGETIETGPTGTNVRDVRILLAG